MESIEKGTHTKPRLLRAASACSATQYAPATASADAASGAREGPGVPGGSGTPARCTAASATGVAWDACTRACAHAGRPFSILGQMMT